MLFKNILIHGFLMSAVLTIILLGSIAYNPRLWLRTYPDDVKAKVPPKTKKEKRLALVFQIPFMIIMLGVPTVSTITLKRNMAEDFTFLTGFVNFAGISTIFNLVDTVIIDWGVFCSITPKFITINGTEGLEGYKDYKMHLKAFIKGLMITAVLSFVFTGIIYLV